MKVVNVAAFAPGLPFQWIHPSNLWVVSPRAGYYVIPYTDPQTGAEWCAVRFIDR